MIFALLCSLQSLNTVSCNLNMAWPKPALIAIEKKTMGKATAIAQKVAILKRCHKRIIRITTLRVEFTHMHLGGRDTSITETVPVELSPCSRRCLKKIEKECLSNACRG